MTGLHWPAGVLVESFARAVIEGIWPFTAYFVKAVAVFSALIAKGLDEFARVKVTATLAQIVNSKAISPFWSVKYIKCGKRTK